MDCVFAVLFRALWASVVLVGLCLWSTGAHQCLIGQEQGPNTNRLRWALLSGDLCRCSTVDLGGVNIIQPRRPFHVSHFDAPLGLSTVRKIIDCAGEQGCWQGDPLGMRDGRIPNNTITASSFYRNKSTHAPIRARPDTTGYASAWCAASDDAHPWIQVDFACETYITGLITQGRRDLNQWVTRYSVTYSDDSQVWTNVIGVNETLREFTGNVDKDSPVTASFGTVIRARFIRIHPIDWNTHCSMRFEIMGCRGTEVRP